MKDLIKLSFTRLWKVYLQPIVQIFTQKSLVALADIAFNFVTEAAFNPSLQTPEARRAWVAEQLKKHDFVTNNQIADSLINLAIELAVQRLKNEKK